MAPTAYTNITITLFLAATGKILGSQTGRDYHLIDPILADPTLGYVMGDYSGHDYYVDILDNDTPKVRPDMGTVLDTENIDADGIDYCTISNIPAGTTLIVQDDTEYLNVATPFEFDSAVPCEQIIRLNNFPYKPEVYIIYAT